VLELANGIDGQLRSHDSTKVNIIDIEHKSVDGVCVAQRAISWPSAVVAVSVVSAALLVRF